MAVMAEKLGLVSSFFGEQMRRYREILGISLRSMSLRTAMVEERLMAIEKGGKPTDEEVARMVFFYYLGGQNPASEEARERVKGLIEMAGYIPSVNNPVFVNLLSEKNFILVV